MYFPHLISPHQLQPVLYLAAIKNFPPNIFDVGPVICDCFVSTEQTACLTDREKVDPHFH
jgi:hypothetical protein